MFFLNKPLRFPCLESPVFLLPGTVKGLNFQAYLGLPQWLSGKESACNAGDAGGTIPGSGKSSGGGNGSLLQRSCLENPMDRGAWWATFHRAGHNLSTAQQTYFMIYLIF